MIARLILFSALLAVPKGLAAQVLPKLPPVARGACPFECCQLGPWTTLDTLRVYPQERSAAKPVALLRPGQSFTADSANFYTLAWGVIVVRRPMRLGHELSPEADSDSVRSDPRGAAVLARLLAIGDTIYHLGHEPETGEIVWLQGVEVTVNWFWADREEDLAQLNAPAVVVKPIKQEWWVRIRTFEGLEGWIQAWDKRIDGRDACA